MQTPGQQMNQLSQQNSISTLVARVRARSTGAPLPFTSQGPVENSESGRGPAGCMKDSPNFLHVAWVLGGLFLIERVRCISESAIKNIQNIYLGLNFEYTQDACTSITSCFCLILFEDGNIFVRLVCSRIHSWQRVPHYGPRRHVFWHCDTCSTQLDFLHHDWQDSREVIASSCLSFWAMQFSLGLWKSDAPYFCTAPLGLRNQVPDLSLWSWGWTTSSVAAYVGNRPKRMPDQTPALKRNLHCDCDVLFLMFFFASYLCIWTVLVPSGNGRENVQIMIESS